MNCECHCCYCFGVNFDGFNWNWPIFGRILLIDDRPNAFPGDCNGDDDFAKLPLLLTGCGKLKIEMAKNFMLSLQFRIFEFQEGILLEHTPGTFFQCVCHERVIPLAHIRKGIFINIYIMQSFQNIIIHFGWLLPEKLPLN